MASVLGAEGLMSLGRDWVLQGGLGLAGGRWLSV